MSTRESSENARRKRSLQVSFALLTHRDGTMSAQPNFETPRSPVTVLDVIRRKQCHLVDVNVRKQRKRTRKMQRATVSFAMHTRRDGTMSAQPNFETPRSPVTVLDVIRRKQCHLV